VKYLLDVNALVALGFLEHEFHGRVAAWVASAATSATFELLTCPITELGFVRVLSQAPQYGLTVAQVRTVLIQMKNQEIKKQRITKQRSRQQGAVRFAFIADDHDVSRLPVWAKSQRQITDGHLAELALANGCVLATLDEGIPGAFLIPE
jgi:predicted nucleic acid-binding protein